MRIYPWYPRDRRNAVGEQFGFQIESPDLRDHTAVSFWFFHVHDVSPFLVFGSVSEQEPARIYHCFGRARASSSRLRHGCSANDCRSRTFEEDHENWVPLSSNDSDSLC